MDGWDGSIDEWREKVGWLYIHYILSKEAA